ncbi:LysR family transcriptional regulator [Salipiger mucosus]|uniref:Putative transcriptional regulatory protein, LysR family n=1 Tax=Salipiger mucosus DSM 16094 TaxID=1123237 RepID=S9QFZ5_9RHOB|nr:LysR family transcriptional regulator [Salipiger mucosus]EPX80356.1 Putative transcriptional regulatory protein, LysR family [Salipiger mucosus DSM 16094]
MARTPLLPSLVALRAFVHVGATGSIRQAGERMHVDHSSISRHLKNLEERLQVQLVRKQGRGLVLTPRGQDYHRRISEAFGLIETATQDLVQPEDGHLAIYAPPGIAHRVLLPNLPALRRRLPDWEILLHTQPRGEIDPEGAGHWVEIHFGDEAPPVEGTRSRHLFRPRLFPVVSPRVDPRWLTLGSPSGLVDVPLIMARLDGELDAWFAHCGLRRGSEMSYMLMPNTHLALEAALYGQGAALANDVIAAQDLASGNLAELFGTDFRSGSYFVVTSEADWDEAHMVFARDWLDGLMPRSETRDAREG